MQNNHFINPFMESSQFQLSPGQLNRQCIESCLTCSDACHQLIEHCLRLGGAHANHEHIAFLTICADSCFLAAKSLSLGSELHQRICQTAAEICEICADDCARLANGDEQMLDCADLCMRCAESCRQMTRH